MTITDRDLAILNHLIRYRYAFTDQIHRLFFSGRTPQAMYLVLKRLAKGGLLTHDYVPRNTVHRLGHLIYSTVNGAKLVAESVGQSLADISYTPIKKKPRSIRFLYHLKRILDFRIALEISLKDLPISLKLLFSDDRRSERLGKKRPETALLDSNGSAIIVPDIIFVLNSHRTGNEQCFMVEIDTGAEVIGGGLGYSSSDSVLGKFNRYQSLLLDTRNIWKQFIDTTARSFRVLFVTETMKRVRSVIQKTQSAEQHSRLLLSTHERIFDSNILTQPLWYLLNNQDEPTTLLTL